MSLPVVHDGEYPLHALGVFWHDGLTNARAIEAARSIPLLEVTKRASHRAPREGSYSSLGPAIGCDRRTPTNMLASGFPRG